MAINHLVNFILPRFPRGVNIFFVFVNGQCPCLFVPSVAHFPAEVEGGVAHDPQFRQFVCHELFIFSPKGAQGSACLAHKSRIYHFVCQSYPLPGRETAPSWHTNPDFTALCAKVSRCPAERQRRDGVKNAFLLYKSAACGKKSE